MAGSHIVKAFLQDVRYAARQLRKNLGFTTVAVFTLALGIGANTAIFSVVDVLLFRPLPVSKPEELARFGSSDTRDGPGGYRLSFPAYIEYRDHAQAFSGLAAWTDRFPVNVSVGAMDSERVDSAMVTGNYFQVLGTQADLGRTFTENDDQAAAQAVVLLSHNFCRRHFSDSKSALGAQVLINGRWFTAVGVLPAGFGGVDFQNFPEVWIPIALAFQIDPLLKSEMPHQDYAFTPFKAVGRLKAGVSLPRAQAELDILALQLGAGKPDPLHGDEFRRSWPVLAPATLAARQGEQSHLSLLLLAVVLLVLLIACADLAGLLLARSEVRQKEISVRLALGGPRWRIASLQLAEAMLIALPGAALGCMLAAFGARLLLISSPPDVPLPLNRAASILDLRVLAFTAAIALVAGVLSTLGPALKYSRSDPALALRRDSRASAVMSRKASPQAALVVLQIAASVVLLAGAGLLTRTLWQASQIRLGFDFSHAAGASTDLIRQGYDKNAAQNLLDPLLDALRAQPGVVSAALGRMPMTDTMSTQVKVEGHENEKSAAVDLVMVSPEYFQTLGIPLMQGRDFNRTDGRNSPGVAIINQVMAEKYWPRESPLGKHVEYVGPHDQAFEVVGIAGGVAKRDLRKTPGPLLYLPLSQSYQMFPWQPDVTLLARSAGDPAPLAGAIRAAVANVDPHLPVFHMRTLQEQAAAALAEQRFLTRLLLVFALIALTLAGAGLFGLISYITQRATHDFGVRIALGAQAHQVQWMVLKRGLRLTLWGLLLGAGSALWLAKILASLLFDVSTADPLTFCAVAVVLLAVTLAACYVPSRRATRVGPLVALRSE